jgi:predicted adenylyl cyclase CyaB
LRNIELKVRLRDPEAARRTAQGVATQRLGTQRQVDTYFHCHQGRLKLRQIDGEAAQLVWYVRRDLAGPKRSDYMLVPVADAQMLKVALSAALGVRGVVEKRREIFLVENVRIHLDEVVGLGSFLEFEAVLSSEVGEPQGQAQVDALAERFGVIGGDLVGESYIDLL